jgi:hypothetical protein
LLLTVLVIYGSSQKWPLPRLAGNLQVSPKIKVYFWVMPENEPLEMPARFVVEDVYYADEPCS